MKSFDLVRGLLDRVQCQTSLQQTLQDIKELFRYQHLGLVVFELKDLQSYRVRDFGHLPSDLIEVMEKDSSFIDYCFNETVPSFLTHVSAQCRTENFDSVFFVPAGCSRQFGAIMVFYLNSKSLDQAVCESIGDYWKIFSSQLFRQYRKYVHEEDFSITARERECIQWASMGKTAWEISQILDISQRTVEYHLANCIRKTNSINRQHAIVKCVLSGQY
ncbi:helix-turn-helix transcriptional regulator [Pseudoalteromonas xiamenensis]